MREFSFNVTEREQLHLEAVEAWAKRDIKKACRKWEQVLLNYPNDVLALKLANDVKKYMFYSHFIVLHLFRRFKEYKRFSCSCFTSFPKGT